MTRVHANQRTDSTTFIAQIRHGTDFFVHYDFLSWAVALARFYILQGGDFLEKYARKDNIGNFCRTFELFEDFPKPELSFGYTKNRGPIVRLKHFSNPTNEYQIETNVPYVKKKEDKWSLLNKSYHCDNNCRRWRTSNMKTDSPVAHGIYGDKHMVYSLLYTTHKLSGYDLNLFGPDSTVMEIVGSGVNYIGKNYPEKKPNWVVNTNFVKRNAINMKQSIEKEMFA